MSPVEILKLIEGKVSKADLAAFREKVIKMSPEDRVEAIKKLGTRLGVELTPADIRATVEFVKARKTKVGQMACNCGSTPTPNGNPAPNGDCG